MNSRDVVVKTAEGVAELKQRSRKLPPRLRTMLIMIDGSLTVAQLKQAAAGLGAPEGFIDTLRANMRHSGALRLDHVMALMRLFWTGPDGGTYVEYPLEDLMAGFVPAQAAPVLKPIPTLRYINETPADVFWRQHGQ